jgi:hypothetical protein
MYINAVANSVTLYLLDYFYNIIFKIKYELYTDSGSTPFPPPPQEKNSECAPDSGNLKREAALSSETSEQTCYPTRRNNPEG